MPLSREVQNELLQQWHQWDEVNLSPEGMNLFFDHLDEFSHVKKLDLSFNRLTTLPPEIGNLSGLEELSLGDNALELLPPELGRLQKLKKLWLDNNKLQSLPDTLAQLNNLQVIGLTKNEFTQIPRWIFFMTNLKTLRLERNPIKEIDLGDFRGIKEDPYPSFDGGIYVDGSVKVYIDLPNWDPPPIPSPNSHPSPRPHHSLSTTPASPSSKYPMVFTLYDRYSHDREYGPADVDLRPIERYFGDLLVGNLSESYYPRVISETTGEMKKNLLEQLPPNHPLIDPLRKALKRELNNSLSLQL